MAGGGQIAGGSPAVGMGATAAELGTTAAGSGLPNNPAMPLWQQGLMGALTGDKAYGAHAPAIHQALAGMLQGQQKQSAPPPMMPQMHPMMGAPAAPQLGAPQMQMGQPFAAPQPIQSMAPWMGRM